MIRKTFAFLRDYEDVVSQSPAPGVRWDDETTPKTDKPVRFWVIPRQHGMGVRVTTHVALAENVPMVA